MKTPFLILQWGLLVLLMSSGLPSEAIARQSPNFVVILGEAQGWASMSVPMDDRHPGGSKSEFILTPHLDSIAMAGIRFSDFYAASPRCTPTRAALFTGRSPAQLHMTFVGEGKQEGTVNSGDKVIPPQGTSELPAGIATIGTLLKQQGYATAHFGKWHCGRISPREHGFDETDGPNSNAGPENVENPNPKQGYAIAELGMDFIARQVTVGKPFYLQLSQYPGKGPLTARADTLESVKGRLGTRMDVNRIGLAAGNEEIDKTIGLVLAKLKALNLMGNTYILYTADHGAQGRTANGLLSNGKGTVWEGGLRVPLLIAGPGIPGGTFSHVRASTVDLLPTVLGLAGLPLTDLPEGLEGGSLVKTIREDPAAVPVRSREELVIHFPHYDKDEVGPASAILFRNYKMIRVYETDERHLFDILQDPGERTDLAISRPEIVKALDSRMTEYLASVKAGLPTPNPDCDPAGERSGDRRGGKGGGGGGKRKGTMTADPVASETVKP